MNSLSFTVVEVSKIFLALGFCFFTALDCWLFNYTHTVFVSLLKTAISTARFIPRSTGSYGYTYYVSKVKRAITKTDDIQNF